jgi:AraC-like DNA-binding protein
MPLTSVPASVEPSFVSQQVTEEHRYYLNLNPPINEAFVVVCGGVERMRPEYVVRRTNFPYYAVEMVADGEGSLVLDGRRFDLAPGVVFAYGPGVPHTIRTNPQNRMRKYYFDFTGTEAYELLQAAGLAQWKALRVASLHEVTSVFQALGREARDDTPLSRSVCETLGRLLLLKIQQNVVAGGLSVPRSYATYERLRRYIEQNYLRLGTVDEIAGECHVTPVHVSRLFRRFGQSGAYQFLLRLKMNHAAELLESGLLVKEIASRIGFADAFQFSRAFKRVHGVPPAVLQASRRPVFFSTDTGAAARFDIQ